jgi:hypothetical protein
MEAAEQRPPRLLCGGRPRGWECGELVMVMMMRMMMMMRRRRWEKEEED